MKIVFAKVLPLLLGGIFFLGIGVTEAQQITGVVTDENSGETLPGVNIILKGTSSGTATGSDGSYELNVPSLQDTLVFSYVGYQTQEVPIEGRTTIDISLQASELMGDEVVVVGYGTERRGELTGSIGSVSAEDFNRGVTDSPEDLMQGKVAGVNIQAHSGQPGSPQTVLIRGPGSLRSGSGPLYVIDGIAIDNSTDTEASSNDFGPGSPSNTNPLAFLNPDDIESIDVLKDASATAIYGSRASDGVIMITTKSGVAGGGQLNYSGSVTVSEVANEIDMLSPEEFVDFHESIGQSDMDMGHRTNYFDAIMRTSLSNSHSLSYSGGTETSNYIASLNYSDREGLVISNKLEKLGGRLRVNQGFLEDRLNVGINLNASRSNTDYVPVANNASTNLGDMLTNSLTQNPTQPIYNEDGSFYEITEEGMNPVQVPEIFTDFGETTRILGSVKLDFQLMDGLEYNFNAAIDNSQSNRFSQVSPHNNQRIDAPEGAVDYNNRENTMLQTESTLNYVFTVDESNFDLLGGFSYQRFEREGRGFAVRDFTTTEIQGYHNPGIGTRVTPADRPDGFSGLNELQSFFGRANYNYNERYYLTATLRADGSSRFGADHRYGFFPSFSAAWQISDEDFMADFDALSNLRLRAGWGQTGNQDIPDGITQARINVNQSDGYQIRPGEIVPGITFVRTQNEDIRWEVNEQTNVGFDIGFFEGALTGTVDLYQKVTTDILFETTTGVDPIAPTSSFWSNYDMEIINRGVELALDYRRQIGDDFYFDIGGNISFLDNEIKNMPVDQIRTGALTGRGLSGETVQVFKNGLPFGAFWVFEFQGLDENGENVFRDVDGDGAITDNDRVSPGSALPDYNYGISANFGYRNWNLGLNFNGKSGNMIYWNDHNALFNMPQLYAGNNIAKIGFNPDESPTNAATASSRFVYDGSYFRLNNATLSYTVNTATLPLRGLELAITGRNLFTITDYPGFDPEVDRQRSVGGFRSLGIDSSRYPTARSLSFSVNLQI